MKYFKPRVFLLFVMIIVFNSLSAKSRSMKLTLVAPKSKLIYPILDSLIQCEQKCNYHQSDSLFILLSTDITKTFNFELVDINRVDNIDNTDGCFKYRNHFIIVDKVIKVEQFKSFPERIEVPLCTECIEPMPYEPSTVICKYINGEFIIEFKYCNCERW